MNIFEKHLEDPVRFKRLKRIGYASLVVIALGEVVVTQVLHLGHGHFWFENLPAFGSGYGLLSCVLFIVVSKFLGHHWLMKKEDYYDDEWLHPGLLLIVGAWLIPFLKGRVQKAYLVQFVQSVFLTRVVEYDNMPTAGQFATFANGDR